MKAATKWGGRQTGSVCVWEFHMALATKFQHSSSRPRQGKRQVGSSKLKAVSKSVSFTFAFAPTKPTLWKDSRAGKQASSKHNLEVCLSPRKTDKVHILMPSYILMNLH